LVLDLARAGRSIPARIAMMAMTTRSSMRVKARTGWRRREAGGVFMGSAVMIRTETGRDVGSVSGRGWRDKGAERGRHLDIAPENGGARRRAVPEFEVFSFKIEAGAGLET
jgi:hypothetical protein